MHGWGESFPVVGLGEGVGCAVGWRELIALPRLTCAAATLLQTRSGEGRGRRLGGVERLHGVPAAIRDCGQADLWVDARN
eukprot:scaffold57859_cov26-Tisochrysis_lutea.AAC.1